MQRKPSKKPKARKDEPKRYMVRFVCEFILEGDVFVTAKKADAARQVRKQMAALGYEEVNNLALYRTRKTRTGRVISERSVQDFLARAAADGNPKNEPPAQQ